MSDRLWILGAPNAAMDAVERLLLDCGEEVAYALVDGQRVTSREEASRSRHWRYHPDSYGSASIWYCVECDAPEPGNCVLPVKIRYLAVEQVQAVLDGTMHRVVVRGMAHYLRRTPTGYDLWAPVGPRTTGPVPIPHDWRPLEPQSPVIGALSRSDAEVWS